MGDTYWIHFYVIAAIFQYLLGNGIISALLFVFGGILIRDTAPNHHISVFALGSVTTDLLARFTLYQPLLSLTTIGLLAAGFCCITSLFRTVIPTKRVTTLPKFAIIGIGVALFLNMFVFGIYFLVHDQQPIRALMEQANLEYDKYTVAAKSPTLRGAVNEYSRRYGRPPPPGFDIWYQFASDRRSMVINEYDQIMEDLKPFWAIEPRVLRERIARIAGNEENYVALIKVRATKVEIGMSPQWKVCTPETDLVNASGCLKRWLK